MAVVESSVKEAESLANNLNETMSFEMEMGYNALSLSNSYAKKPDFPQTEVTSLHSLRLTIFKRSLNSETFS